MSAPAETLLDTSWTNELGSASNPGEDTGLHALVYAASMLDIPCNALQVWHLNGRSAGSFDHLEILRSAKKLKLKAQSKKIKLTRINKITPPALVFELNTKKYYVFEEFKGNTVFIRDSIKKHLISLTLEEFCSKFSDDVILLGNENYKLVTKKRFGYGWFIPAIFKHAARFRKVIAAALIIQIIALVTPMMFQVVIDKVLVSRSLQTLDVIAIGLLALAIIDPLISFIREVIFSHIASCVNSQLSTKLFQHLIRLPLSYFGNRQIGDIVARVRELDHVRNFLTGSALMMVLDLFFIGVFLFFMFSYSSQLTWVVIASLITYMVLWAAFAPIFRVRVEHMFERNAENTAFLTEAVTGVETLKSLAAGKRFNNEWKNRQAFYLKSSFRTNILGHWAGGAIGLIQKVLTATILWFGVSEVLEGGLTVGSFVAFNMLSKHVTMPILRLAQIWQDFQRTGVSIRRIGDILNEETEFFAGAGQASIEKVYGNIELRQVSFKYSEDSPEVLKRLNLNIKAGEKVGITGLSGSGKSTITKLVQRLYVPQSGSVLIDGVDLALADTAMLRTKMGVVLQESFLFNGTIRENIALGNPQASMEDIKNASILAGADSFIMEMQGQYDSHVGEKGNNLSGGQKQRIAIARALLTDPSIFILDEATSALDYESEHAILNKLPEILKGRTALVIAHRLNVMRLCDRVLVMEKGQIIEEGIHAELIQQEGVYQELWDLQNN